MSWIESHDELPTHPKTLKAARKLKVGIPAVIGHLHMLWYWCLTHRPDGVLADMDADDVADAAGWMDEGETFVKALLAAGWLDDESGTLVVHDWWEGAGKTITRRTYATKRQRKARESRQTEAPVTDESPDSHADVTRDTNVSHGADRDSDTNKVKPDGDADAPSFPRIVNDGTFTEQVIGWAKADGHIRQINTKAERTRWALDLASHHLGDTPRGVGAATELVVEWVEHACGEPLATSARKHLVRLINTETPGIVFAAMEAAVTGGAGLSQEYAEDPQALVRYAKSCISRWRVEGSGRAS